MQYLARLKRSTRAHTHTTRAHTHTQHAHTHTPDINSHTGCSLTISLEAISPHRIEYYSLAWWTSGLSHRHMNTWKPTERTVQLYRTTVPVQGSCVFKTGHTDHPSLPVWLSFTICDFLVKLRVQTKYFPTTNVCQYSVDGPVMGRVWLYRQNPNYHRPVQMRQKRSLQGSKVHGV